jgi:hypothetical protein
MQVSAWQSFRWKRLLHESSNRPPNRKYYHQVFFPESLGQSQFMCASMPYHINFEIQLVNFFQTCAQPLLATAPIIFICCISLEAASASILPVPLHNIQVQSSKTTPKPIGQTSYDLSSRITDDLEHISKGFAGKKYQWAFENGDVTLPEVIYAHGLKLTSPRLLGSGAGGAVFAMQNENMNNQLLWPTQVALKVSWRKSAASVSNECYILKKLQTASLKKYGSSISTIETCLGEIPYEAEEGRTSILLEPVFIDTQATSLQDFSTDPEKMITAARLIIRTLLQILSEHIATSDVQPLISRETGNILFIDFTEAMTFEAPDTVHSTDNPVIRNFINEMFLLLPESLHDNTRKKIFLQELEKYPIETVELRKLLAQYFL